MRRALAAALLFAALAAVPPAQAQEMEDESAAATARVLALQALVLLEQGRQHAAAEQKLDEALAAEEAGGIDLQALRAAHEALHREATAQATALLQQAFPEEPHVVGVTYRPRIRTAQAAAGAAGGVLLAIAAIGLVARRRADRHLGAG